MALYQEKNFALPAMEGLSEKQIDVHLKLYAGYVKNVNTLSETLNALKADPGKNALAISELTRRFNFEWNGMRMHEFYFEGLGGNGEINGELKNLLAEQFGSFEAWEEEFKRVGKMRGIGWTICALDAQKGNVFNVWVNDHELGQLAGGHILIAMDMWEHAFMVDYLPSEKGSYIEAFFKNLKWDEINNRLAAARA